MERLLWRVSEVADATGLSQQEIYLLVRRGLLRGVHVGKAVRIPASELERLTVHGIPTQRVAE